MARTPVTTDSHTAADGTVPTGTDLANGFGVVQIIGNKYYSQYGFPAEIRDLGTFNPVQYAQCVLSGFSGTGNNDEIGVGLLFSADVNPNRDGYRVYVRDGATKSLIVEKVVNDSIANLRTDTTQSWVDTDVLSAEADPSGGSSTIIKLFRNGVQVGANVVDSISPHTTGKPVRYAKAGANQTLRGDDYEAGNGFLASALSAAVNPATETDSAQPITRAKRKAVGIATETDAAQAITRKKRKALGIATETDSAQPITRAGVGPAFTLDLTTTAPAELTFTRAGSRTAVESGVFVTKSSNVPAFESWDGVNRGLAVEASLTGGAITQSCLRSDDMQNAFWSGNYAGVTLAGGGGVGPFGTGSNTIVSETAANTIHQFIAQNDSVPANTPFTYSVICKPKSGATRWGVRLVVGNFGNNTTNYADFRIDGVPGFYHVEDTTHGTGLRAGSQKLANGLFRLWVSFTTNATVGSKWFQIQQIPNNSQTIGSAGFLGSTSEGHELFGMQLHRANGPAGWVTTTTASLTQPAETAIISHAALASLSQGTFVIEHDCHKGVLIGSGANTVLSATVPGKTAIAWSGSTSDVVNNGGAASAGALPTFGADIRLLGSSAVGNVGHVKSIKFYSARLSVADMQAATAPTVANTAQIGVYRAASVDDRLPQGVHTTAGALLYIASRFRVKLGGNAYSSLKLDFANIGGFLLSVGNSVVVDDVFIERVSTPQCVRVTRSGSNSFTLTDQQINALSDSILPSSFTGLSSTFPADEELWVQIRAHVASAGQKFPIGRRIGQTGVQCRVYDPANSTVTIGTPGTLAFTGTSGTHHVGLSTYGFSPILVGVAASGDPITYFVAGDSLVESVYVPTQPGTFIRRALENLRYPSIEFSAGGSTAESLSETTFWRPYMAYCRAWIDEWGGTNPNIKLAHFRIYDLARTTYGYGKVLHFGLLPKTTGTFLSDGGQTVVAGLEYDSNFKRFMDSAALYGFVSAQQISESVRSETDINKWKSSTGQLTLDGAHQNAAGDNLLTTEVQAFLAANSQLPAILGAAVGTAVETDTAQPITRRKTRILGQAVETDTAQSITVVAAQPRAINGRLVNRVASSRPRPGRGPFAYGKFHVRDLRKSASPAPGPVIISLGQAVETDTAQPITRGKRRAVGQAAETDTSQAILRRKTRSVSQALEADTAQAIARRKRRAVGQVTEIDTAQSISKPGTQSIAVGQALEADTAQTITRRKLRSVGQAVEIDTAQSISKTATRLIAVGQATETDTARTLTWRIVRSVGLAAESDQALPIQFSGGYKPSPRRNILRISVAGNRLRV